MSILLHHRWCRRLFAFMLVLGIASSTAAMAIHLQNDSYVSINASNFSVLILGDSEMAGDGWEGGYANCISEGYPNAQVLNLAQSGSLLANGDIYAQWEFFLSQDFALPDLVLLDGGINDLPYTQREKFKNTGMSLVQDAFSTLVEQIHEVSPSTHIIYILMPPLEEWKDSKNGPPSYEIQEHYWKQMNILASSYDYVTVLDLFSLNPFRFPCAECYHENFADSVHLSEAGYRKTFEYIDNILVVRLAKMLDEWQ